MIVSLDIPNNKLTKYDLKTSSSVADGAGIYILMNPKIETTDRLTLETYSLLNENMTA